MRCDVEKFDWTAVLSCIVRSTNLSFDPSMLSLKGLGVDSWLKSTQEVAST